MDLVKEITRLIDIAMAEDIGSGDTTTQACIPENAMTSAKLTLKQAGVIAGLPFLQTLFHKIDPRIVIQCLVDEGSSQKAGAILAKIEGPARGIVSGERVALNLIQHASGVATATAAYVKKITGFRCVILDTRKTLPGLRALEKYAVKVGGGHNHRFGLDDRYIIKIKHLTFVAALSPHPITQAVKAVQTAHQGVPIEVEIEDLAQLDEALETDVVAIVLVNMTPEEARKCVDKIRKTSKKVYIESSTTITLDTIRAYAESGVDGISVGALTHSVQGLDIGMRL